eukprot:TRINITY_DN1923_c0_g3_i1.p1 TRINITY_DN1923_c0_g3~~TRINITY_DN1923_c0_g3_i1.p1  ORF type:complete len:115 (-),score=26.76 TRINITY_DN1923_c0_g3_i1:268-612(-)
MVFSIGSPTSFDDIQTKWDPEVSERLPNIPKILVGTKSDLRTDTTALSALEKKGQAPIMALRAQALAKEIGAVGYFECSALKKEGLSEIFDQAARAALTYAMKDNSDPKRCAIS